MQAPFVLFLSFDVNRTMIFQDSRQNQSDEESFNGLVEKCQGNMSPSALSELKSQVLDNKTNTFATSVFSSVFTLFAKLREVHISFVVNLRSFGSDKQLVQDALRIHSDGIDITRTGRFRQRQLSLDDGTVLGRMDEVFHRVLLSGEHFAITDDYEHWKNHDYHPSAGKPFVFDSSGETSGIRHISVFFDDHYTGDPNDDIVCPIDLCQGPTRAVNKIFSVNPFQAYLDAEYYVKLVRDTFSANGIHVLGF